MKQLKTGRYICICSNKYGIVTKVFSANTVPMGEHEKIQVAKALNIWMEEDEVELHPLQESEQTFIFNL